MRVIATALLCFVLPLSANAELFLIQEGQDSSPYAFLPELSRGFYNSAYAFTNDIGGTDHSFEFFIQFDLPPRLLEPGTVVQEAYAWVYYGFDYTVFGDSTDEMGELLCHEVLEPWNETTLTWNNRPAIGTWFERVPTIDEYGLQFCDVTNQVQRWIDDPSSNHGIALTSGALRVVGYYTFDDGTVSANFKPSLVVEALPEPGTAAGLATGIGLLVVLQRRAARRNPLSKRGDP